MSNICDWFRWLSDQCAKISLVNCLWFRSGDDFLEERIFTQRDPLPARSQMGKGNAVIAVIDCDRTGQESFDSRKGFVRLASARVDQCEKNLDHSALEQVPR